MSISSLNYLNPFIIFIKLFFNVLASGNLLSRSNSLYKSVNYSELAFSLVISINFINISLIHVAYLLISLFIP